MSHEPLTVKAIQYNLFGGSSGVWGKRTGDPVVEEISAVCGGIGWYCNCHCKRYDVRTLCLGTTDVHTLGEVGPCSCDGDSDW